MASDAPSPSVDSRRLARAEQTRRGYLAALGIVQYEARAPLPHAQASVTYEWAALREHPHPSAQPPHPLASEHVSAAAPARTDVLATTDSVSQPDKNPVDASVSLGQVRITPPPEPAVESTRRANAAHRFSLCVSRCYQGRLLVTQPEQGQSWLNAAEQRLTDDVLRALAQTLDVSGTGRYFHWPLLPSPGQPQGAEQPPDAFRGFMESLIQQESVKLIVLSGRAAMRVFPQAEAHEASLIDWPVAGGVIRVGIIPTLGDMLRDWHAKAIAWQRMKSWMNGV